MELNIKLNHKIEDIQRRLRECNFDCNRLKELVTEALPSLTADRDAVIAELEARLEQQQDKAKDLSKTLDETLIVDPFVETSLPEAVPESIEAMATPITAPQPPVEAPETPVVSETPASVVPPPLPPAKRKAPQQRPAAQAPRPKAKTKTRSGKSVEEFIGGNLLNKIGIGILIIGIGIFVKYAIDQDWIGPVGRVLIGLLSGGILMGVAHKLRKAYKAFSSVLLGGGIAVLYFSVAIAFHEYALIGQTASFALMCVITAAAVFFSILYDRQEISILALLGGFATPFLISTGSGNFVALFSYLLVLNIGMMVLSWYRDWSAVRILSYAITILLFGGWLVTSFFITNAPVLGAALGFGTLFFIVFFAMNLAFHVKSKKPATALTYILLLSNSAFYFASSMLILSHMQDGKFMGLFTALMGVFHFAFIFPVRKLLPMKDHLQVMLIGMVLTFLTLAIPIQLRGNHITLFWAAEAVIILVLAQRSGINLMRRATLLVSLLAIGSLVRDWSMMYYFSDSTMPFLANNAFVTSMFTAIAMIALYVLYKREGDKHPTSGGLSQVYQFATLPVLYLGILFELIFAVKGMGDGMMMISGLAFTAVYLCAMSIWAIKDQRKEFGNFIAILSMMLLVGYIGAHFTEIAVMREYYRLGFAGGEGFGWHLAIVPAIFVLLGLNFYHLKEQTGFESDTGKALIWGTSIIFILLCSLQLDNFMIMAGVSLNTAHKVGYPILWGIIGFGMIALGMRHKMVPLRLGGLGLFLLILLKLFIFDIRSVPTGGKIAAFISLGLLLLVISFMYQKLKKLLFEEEEETEELSEAA